MDTTKILEKAYLKARSSAAGLTNYCEDSASVRRCEKELEEAEAFYGKYLDAAKKTCGYCDDIDPMRCGYYFCKYCGRDIRTGGKTKP